MLNHRLTKNLFIGLRIFATFSLHPMVMRKKTPTYTLPGNGGETNLEKLKGRMAHQADKDLRKGDLNDIKNKIRTLINSK